MIKKAANGTFSVTAYAGDFRTLLAFDLSQGEARSLAGFSIQVAPQDGKSTPYFLQNTLQFEADASTEPKNGLLPPKYSDTEPFQKFRWLHVPGQFHQGASPFQGAYTYTVTPRYFTAPGTLAALEGSKSVAVTIPVAPFQKQALSLGFCRGFTQSQAFVHHFGLKTPISPKNLKIGFDSSTKAGNNAQLGDFSFAQEWEWLGATARVKIFDLLNDALEDKSLTLDLFAYDLNEPDIIKILLALASEQRLRVVLDNSKEHHNEDKPTIEDAFADAFVKADGRGDSAPIVRGHFSVFAHDKCFIASKDGKGVRVLTGSTNFSVTGMYVNSNHVLIFDDPGVADEYRQLFEEVYGDRCTTAAFTKTKFSTTRFIADLSPAVPSTSVTFAPHTKPTMQNALGKVVTRIEAEESRTDGTGSVLFAVMDIGGTSKNPNMVEDKLRSLHEDAKIYTYGISDTKAGIRLYKRGEPEGVLVTGRPAHTVLPPPFDQVPNITNPMAHQVHHKFVVCGFNGPDPTVFCGSSNLAEGGEMHNGDNLLEIHDADVAQAFAIEAVGLIDHFDFLDRADVGKDAQPAADTSQDAVAGGLFLDSTDTWAASYFDPSDFHCMERQLYART